MEGSPRLRGWRVDLARTAAAGLGSLLALTAAGWPADAADAALVGFAGVLLGLAVEFGAEHVLRLRAEVLRLQSIERQLADEQAQRKQERELREYQLMVANRRAAVAEVDVEVWGGLFNEANKAAASPTPVSVILARKEVLQKARGLLEPLPPPPGSQKT